MQENNSSQNIEGNDFERNFLKYRREPSMNLSSTLLSTLGFPKSSMYSTSVLWKNSRKTLNTCVIFNTDSDSFHGVPTPLNCPEERTRNSIALYYYTDEPRKTRLRATNYQARPGEGFQGVLIWLDKMAIAIYTRLKRRLGFSDETIGRLLAKIRRRL